MSKAEDAPRKRFALTVDDIAPLYISERPSHDIQLIAQMARRRRLTNAAQLLIAKWWEKKKLNVPIAGDLNYSRPVAIVGGLVTKQWEEETRCSREQRIKNSFFLI